MDIAKTLLSDEVIAALIGALLGGVITTCLSAFFSRAERKKNRWQQPQVDFGSKARAELIVAMSDVVNAFSHRERKCEAVQHWRYVSSRLIKSLDLNIRHGDRGSSWNIINDFYDRMHDFTEALIDKDVGDHEVEKLRLEAIKSWRRLDDKLL
ncbi:MAG: hypothetical protein H7X92_12870 [Chitinophagales bacterium]|nr:hypothetical protein [Hyphomicrobiales bacterium]